MGGLITGVSTYATTRLNQRAQVQQATDARNDHWDQLKKSRNNEINNFRSEACVMYLTKALTMLDEIRATSRAMSDGEPLKELAQIHEGYLEAWTAYVAATAQVYILGTEDVAAAAAQVRTDIGIISDLTDEWYKNCVGREPKDYGRQPNRYDDQLIEARLSADKFSKIARKFVDDDAAGYGNPR